MAGVRDVRWASRKRNRMRITHPHAPKEERNTKRMGVECNEAKVDVISQPAKRMWGPLVKGKRLMMFFLTNLFDAVSSFLLQSSTSKSTAEIQKRKANDDFSVPSDDLHLLARKLPAQPDPHMFQSLNMAFGGEWKMWKSLHSNLHFQPHHNTDSSFEVARFMMDCSRENVEMAVAMLGGWIISPKRNLSRLIYGHSNSFHLIYNLLADLLLWCHNQRNLGIFAFLSFD
ncbi:hypothetical protein ACLOJK_014266 [Asimina triloba]